jgi:hypothetical protein
MSIKIGDIVTINEQDEGSYVVIGQAVRGWWLQDGETGALVSKPYTGMGNQTIHGHLRVEGFMPRELTVIGHYGMSK